MPAGNPRTTGRCRLLSHRPPARHRAAALLVAGLAALAALPAAAQPPAFVAVATAHTANPGFTGGADFGLTVPVPAGAVGDLLVLVVGVKINPATTTPAGWTSIVSGTNNAICASDPSLGIRCQLNAYWRIADGSESSVAVSFGPNPRQAAGAVVRYSGTHPTTPIGPFADQKGTSAAPAAPSVTTAEANDRVLFVGLTDADDAEALLGSPPPTQRFNLASTVPFGPGSSFTDDAVALAGSDEAFAAAGATGSRSWSLPSAEQWGGLSIAIRPASAVSESDLSVTKDDGVTVVDAGGTTTYTVVVTNAGPDAATGATVSDVFPTALSCTWTCTASAGASCTAGPVSGDVADSVDLPAGGTATYSAACDVDAGASGNLANTATVAAPAGVIDAAGNNSATDTDSVNRPPVALCQDVVVAADAACQGTASVDAGSFDPDGDAVTIGEIPAPPYALGDTLVELTIDDGRLSDSCTATVTVVDEAAPVIQCNAPATITPPDTPLAFTATATDNCSVASVSAGEPACYKVNGKGKVVGGGPGSCALTIAGSTVSVAHSGGVGNHLTWKVTAVDGSGNAITMSCEVEVVNPGH